MHNTSCIPLSFLPLSSISNGTPPCNRGGKGVMLLLHAFTSLSLLFLIINLSSLLLIKLFTFLLHKPSDAQVDTDAVAIIECSSPKDDLIATDERNTDAGTIIECSSPKEDLIADIVLGGEALLFRYSGSFLNDTLVVEQGKDSKEQVCFEVEETKAEESTYGTPSEDPPHEKLGIEYNDVPIIEAVTPSDCPSPILSPSENSTEEKCTGVEVCEDEEEEEDILDNEKFLFVNHSDLGSKKFKLEDGNEDKENYGSSITGESTSKSSIEWRSSTIFRDSEVEYPFSSSSRKSSSRWESYTMFRKYDEEMIFFDRISAQKLTETESFRSLRAHPRSISQRIAHRLTTKHSSGTRGRDPYHELESAYVAQICLTWEALNWNYYNFKKFRNADRDTEDSCCPATIAQQFQQFQVLLQRFIETEPYERGRRPEVYARVRISSPKLLRVPEFRECDDEDGENDASSMISSTEFLVILEDAIQTFMNFLKADKESHCQKLRAFIKKKSSSVDPSFLHLLKKMNKKKKLRLKEVGRRRKCLRKRKLKGEEEMEIVMGLIDMKVVSRVLRMPEISEQQLHWCEEKMGKVRVLDGKLQRDPFPLFFPAH